MDAYLEKKKLTVSNQKKRLAWLDFGKAAGILVVLLVHAECAPGPATFYGGMFYMPIFFMAAGYVYPRAKGERYASWLWKKAVRLLAPYFGTSAFLWLFFWAKDSLLSGNPSDLKLLTLFGILYSRNQMYTEAYAGENPVLLNVLNSPLWFLTAMLLTYAWYGALDRSRRKYLFLALGAACAALWHYQTALLLPWSLDAVPYFACFFAAGEALKERKQEKLLGELWVLGLLLAVFLLSSQLNGSMNLSVGNYGRSMTLALLSGISGSLLVFAAGMCAEQLCPPVIKAVSFIGRETLAILCWHMFLFLFIRTGASAVGLNDRLTRTALVAGSIVLLSCAGHIFHMKKEDRGHAGT